MAKCTVDKVIKVAKSQVGYLEKKSNKDLDSFTKNAGDNNYTIYAEEYKKFAGSNYQGQAWCDMYVDAIFVRAYGVEDAKRLLNGFSAYTPTSASYFQKIKQWFTNKPQIGDVIFFKNTERINHTGLVVNVTATRVYTIEGNTSDGSAVIENGGAVCEKNYLLTNSRIAGYGRPKYDKEEVKVEIPKQETQKYAYEYYSVKSGDTLSKIAIKYKTTVDNIVKLNSIKNPNNISINQKLLVTSYPIYKVGKGDTLAKISLAFLGNTNRYKEIMELNNKKNTIINIGEELKIPNKGSIPKFV